MIKLQRQGIILHMGDSFCAMIAFALAIVGTSGLIIENKESNTMKTYRHFTADDFGKKEPYNVKAELVFPPEMNSKLCHSMAEVGGNNATITSIQHNIVMVMRGNCTFYTKALNAQRGGASGLIIANNEFAMFPMKMVREGSLVEDIKIPVVSITRKDHFDISGQMLRDVNVTFLATLNQRGDYSAITLPIISPIIIIFIWMTIMSLYLLRRVCMRYLSRQNRVSAMRDIPLVRYEHPPENDDDDDDDDGVAAGNGLVPQPVRVMNSRCVICMEDFERGEELKLLPCGHGFHPACIDPWLQDHSERCPICNQSLIVQQHQQQRQQQQQQQQQQNQHGVMEGNGIAASQLRTLSNDVSLHIGEDDSEELQRIESGRESFDMKNLRRDRRSLI
eukprot:jgi/Bigna1/88824/estExt_fgenesh1_pg.C_390003